MEARILAVDDEPASLRAVGRALAGEGMLRTAPSAEAAWDILERESFCVLVADQRLPGMTGTRLLERVAQRFPDLVRILLTAHADTATLVEAINAGHVFAYVMKPWAAHELRLAVRRGIERSESGRRRRHLEEELTTTCRRLVGESERSGRRLTLAAHELATPVHVLEGLLEELAACDDATERRSLLQRGHDQLSWLAHGLTQLQAAGHWKAGNPTLRPVPVLPAPLFGPLRRRLDVARARRSLEVGWDLPSDLPAVVVDPPWILRAVANLLDNAVRHTPDGGRVELRVRIPRDRLEIEVQDTGIGIPPERAEEVFEPFGGGDDVLEHTSGRWQFGSRGLGLGLATARRIARAHDGDVVLLPPPSRGSCFRLWVPRAGPVNLG